MHEGMLWGVEELWEALGQYRKVAPAQVLRVPDGNGPANQDGVDGLLGAGGVHGSDLARKKPGSNLRYRERKWICTSFARFDSEEVTAISGFRVAQSSDVKQMERATCITGYINWNVVRRVLPVNEAWCSAWMRRVVLVLVLVVPKEAGRLSFVSSVALNCEMY
ncbi:hypothetical protein BDR03DRAFT_983142 [Suillus americanus]|nr:hypothetical protein BDR03DRAFT_983142 [Suillus americanus]